ncbi:hypothetical protein Nepgr_021005 [Nepenthes gracilis]|uniref:Uncharacterized protein n=1 Tax=Nepenthes gracilis TaxID=150966 RepID=A0AAD3SXZ3_NEPGR|nr:hypothetical protein Nepgr_021005 [Nepenthes gracilis]
MLQYLHDSSDTTTSKSAGSRIPTTTPRLSNRAMLLSKQTPASSNLDNVELGRRGHCRQNPGIKLDAAAEPRYGRNSTFPIEESDAQLSNQVTRGRNLNNERETRSWERRKARVSSGTGARTNRSFKETCEKDQAEEVKRMPEEEQEEPRGGQP